DPQAERVQHDARIHFGRVGQVRSARIYLIEAPLTEEQARAVAGELLADNVNQQYFLGNAPTTDDGSEVTIEVHYQPGVMDPVAQSTRDAIVEMLEGIDESAVNVRTGF